MRASIACKRGISRRDASAANAGPVSAAENASERALFLIDSCLVCGVPEQGRYIGWYNVMNPTLADVWVDCDPTSGIRCNVPGNGTKQPREDLTDANFRARFGPGVVWPARSAVMRLVVA